MDICIVGENCEEISLWSSLLSNSFPCFDVKETTFSNLESSSIDKTECAIILLNGINNSVLHAANMFRGLSIPILCIITTIDHIESNLNKQLFYIGVQGVLVAGKTSMDNVGNSIHLVRNGGVYIEPYLNEMSQIENPIETIDLLEWQVFSLTAKGLDADNIASTLQITVDDTKSYQARFKELYLRNYKPIETI